MSAGEPTHPFPKHTVAGLEYEYVSADDGIRQIVNWSRAKTGAYVCVPNVHACVTMAEDEAFASATRGAALRLTDSTVLQKARSWLYGVPVPETVLGSRLMERLCRSAAAAGVPVGFYGGTPDSLLALKARLEGEIERLSVAYAYAPPFRPASEAEHLASMAEINASGAGLLFVGLGCPKQEKWMAQAHPHLPNTVMIGVGAAFDTLGGRTKESKEWVHKLGFEWLHRLLTEPRRLWRRYLFTSPLFLWRVFLQKLASPVRPQSAQASGQSFGRNQAG